MFLKLMNASAIAPMSTYLAILTILFTSNGLDRYPLTLRFDVSHLDDFFWRLNGGGVQLERRYDGHIYVSADTFFL